MYGPPRGETVSGSSATGQAGLVVAGAPRHLLSYGCLYRGINGVAIAIGALPARETYKPGSVRLLRSGLTSLTCRGTGRKAVATGSRTHANRRVCGRELNLLTLFAVMGVRR